MSLLAILAVAAAAFVAASALAVYSYGRFAARRRGRPSSALPVQPAETPLDRDIGALNEGRGEESGLTLLSDNLDAFAVRAHAARNAGRSLDLLYYYWKGDLTGRLLAHEVIAAADRGVRVRMLLDDINTRGKDALYLAFDRHPRIEVRLFNPGRARSGTLLRGLEMVLRPFRTTRRMHNKAWIADGRLAIVGGRNIGDEYFDAGENSNFRDLDVALVGPLVQETETVFDAFWNSTMVLPIRTLADRKGVALEKLRRQQAKHLASDIAAPFIARVAKRLSARRTLEAEEIHWTNEARIVSDPPEKARGEGRENWLMQTFQPVIARAEHSFQVTSPYFIPGDNGAEELVRLAGRGVEVSVLTNSLAATDVAAVHGGYAPYRKALLAGGVRLYELQPHGQQERASIFGSSTASLHTKAFTVDEADGFIGSFNFDPRSASLNTEMGVLFRSAGLVAEMRALFETETAPALSYRVFLSENGGLRWQGGREGAGDIFDHEPEASLSRRIIARIVEWLPIESQL
jgi:putative cardiolipin synthase